MIEILPLRKNGGLGFFHASANPITNKLLIICPSLFDEYQRCYKGLVNLSNSCSNHPDGLHVLRIDYFGTGEADGHLEDAAVSDWIKDIHSAIVKGVELTGAGEVVLLGIRCGALLAAQVQQSQISHYIFWDPVYDGKEALAWLDRFNIECKRAHYRISNTVNLQAEDISYDCFQLNSSTIDSIRTMSANGFYGENKDRISLLSSNKSLPAYVPSEICLSSSYYYDWPLFHETNFMPKSILEDLKRMVLEA